ncbi:hypothetical protein M2150_002711 [Lachnospiraceae bacterium PM6-15]|uniref:hypothetical protein n=1 Tax=Ohessyouella blattaphilus TaxID=2949333 RepID=UPI003E20389D
MVDVTQEQLDEYFRVWIRKQEHSLELIEQEGFTREEAIELMKINQLERIASRQ